MIRACLAISLAIAAAGCVAMGGTISLPTGNTKNWMAYGVDVGDQVVRFRIPPGINEDFLDAPVPQRIDLEQYGLFNRADAGPKLLSRRWDYKLNSRESIAGTLRASIALWCSENVLDSIDALQSALEKNKELLKAKDISEGGTGGPPDKMQFESAVVGGNQALLVHHQNSPSNYAMALDAHHYLLIYVSGRSVSRPGWHEDAVAAADAILGSIRIERKQ